MALYRKSMLGRADHGEANTLETDVVRFVAIVGLTLMIIFALVQALPYTGEAQAEVEVRPQVDDDVVTLTQTELNAMRDHAATLQADLERAAQRAAELEAELSAQSATVRSLTVDVESQADAEHELARLNREVLALGDELSSARTDAERARRQSSAAEQRHGEETRRLLAEIDYLETQVALMDDVPDEPEPTVVQEGEPELEAEPMQMIVDPEPVVAMVGGGAPDALVLRFRDDEVYLDLLEADKIQGYLHIPELDLIYQVHRESERRLRFSLVYQLSDGELYEIPDAAVPDVLRDETRRFDLRYSLRNDLDYLVVLSDRIREQVTALQAAGKTGYYDILDDERVVAAGAR